MAIISELWLKVANSNTRHHGPISRENIGFTLFNAMQFLKLGELEFSGIK